MLEEGFWWFVPLALIRTTQDIFAINLHICTNPRIFWGGWYGPVSFIFGKVAGDVAMLNRQKDK